MQKIIAIFAPHSYYNAAKNTDCLDISGDFRRNFPLHYRTGFFRFWTDSIYFCGMCCFNPFRIFKHLSYKDRKRQILLNNISIFINALLLGLLAYWLLSLSGGINFPEKGIEPLFPLISMICLFIANIYIRKDDRLVKSVDRLR